MADQKAGTSRRDILKLGAATVPAAVAAVATGAGAGEAAAAEARSDGLRKTAHVRKYWETARF